MRILREQTTFEQVAVQYLEQDMGYVAQYLHLRALAQDPPSDTGAGKAGEGLEVTKEGRS